MRVLLLLLALASCQVNTSSDTDAIGTIDSIYRVDRSDHYELIVSCSDGFDWTLSDRNVNPGGYGTGEFRIREVFDGANRVVGYGGLGYLQNAANWIAGSHGFATEPLGFLTEPRLDPGETIIAGDLTAQFVIAGYSSGSAVVALVYNVSFDCATYTEQIKARALADYQLSFEYVAVAVGPGACLLSGAYDTVNGISGYGCATSTTYSYLDASQMLELEGSGYRLTVVTDVPLSELDHTLVRDQNTPAIKAYAVRPGRSVVRLDEWSVANTYQIERL